MTRSLDGAGRLAAELRSRGVQVVFGLPGTQNTAVYEALHAAGIRCVVPTSENAASFMANGYARVSGEPAVMAVIPGPGLVWSLPGIAEAFLDSVPVVCVTGTPADSPGRRFQLQAFDQDTALKPLTKGVYRAQRGHEVAQILDEAWRTARAGEPGPVVVQLSDRALTEDSGRADSSSEAGEVVLAPPAHEAAREVLRRLEAARRPLLFVGQGSLAAADLVRSLAEAEGAAVITTTSARGVVPEDHPLVVPADGPDVPVDALNELLAASDLVLALGCKFTHNGSFGFRLRLDPERLVHVDASGSVLGANYPADLQVEADVPAFLGALWSLRDRSPAECTGWPPEELERWRGRLGVGDGGAEGGRSIRGFGSLTVPALFRELRAALPPEAIVVTDSGLHQMELRRHFRVLAPRGLLVPTDFQSMGFGVPAGIGAALVRPGVPVVAVVGDGGIAMSGLELRTAADLGVSLKVLVVNDGAFGLIRRQQVREFGRAPASTLSPLDLGSLARAVGVAYRALEPPAVDAGPSVVRTALQEWLEEPGTGILDVPVGDAAGSPSARVRAAVRGSLLRGGMGSAIRTLRRVLRRNA